MYVVLNLRSTILTYVEHMGFFRKKNRMLKFSIFHLPLVVRICTGTYSYNPFVVCFKRSHRILKLLCICIVIRDYIITVFAVFKRNIALILANLYHKFDMIESMILRSLWKKLFHSC